MQGIINFRDQAAANSIRISQPEIQWLSENEIKDKGKGIDIEYGIHDSPFGKCFIANSLRGICALEFLDDNQPEVTDAFKRKWANASIKENTQATGDILFNIFSDDPTEIKILLSGTAFQVKVWQELCLIPFAHRVSYDQIAEKTGIPGACRAVGTAIGRNNLAFLIPCHRVVRKTGQMGGYKWGIERKISILEWEKQQINKFRNL